MTYLQKYDSPIGTLLLAAEEDGMTGLWFVGQTHFAAALPAVYIERETPVLAEARRWLDCYFTGREPQFMPPLRPSGTEFRQRVWRELRRIPYGQTVTYGEIARRLSPDGRLAAQAVGGAVGHNPISILIPCHRVVGADGSLTGYAGGLAKKIALLELERADMSRFYIPRR